MDESQQTVSLPTPEAARSAEPVQTPETAPTYPVPARKLSAVEHPLIIKDVDKAIKTFGRSPAFQTVR